MPISPRVDCHLHTATFSCDARATLDGFVAQAQRLGLNLITTTEHVDFDPRDGCYGHYNQARHLAQREQVRARSFGPLQVLVGVEVDYQAQYEADARRFLEDAGYDFVIGSVHYAGGEFIFGSTFLSGPERANYEAYFEQALHAVRSGLFDVLGHPDIVKRYGVEHYGPFQPARYTGQIDALLRACIETGTGIEVNTSGYRGPPGEPFPSLPVLRRYRELGGELLTVGSDAHVIEDLWRDVPLALELAARAGFRAVTVFVDRQPSWLPIDLHV
jgi:histidinol-phosphatase (PHP family)